MPDQVKEATIRLKLDSREYETKLSSLDRPAKEAGEKSGAAFSSAFGAGIKGAKSAVEGMFSSIKTGLLTFSGIAGAAGIGELTKHALQAEGSFKKLAFQVQAGTGRIVNFREMMDKAKDSAMAWGKNVDELGAAMTKMFEETGSVESATGNIDTVAMVARASREPVEALGAAAGMLSKKFKVANGDMSDALGVLLSAANKGGLSFDELSGRLGYVGAIAKEAGLEGKNGLEELVGMINMGEESSKNLRKALGTVSSLVEEFGKKPARTKLLMHLGIDPTSIKGGLSESIEAIIAKTGGAKEKLQVGFKNEGQVEFLVDIGKSYAQAFANTKGTVQEKTKAGLEALHNAMEKAAQSNMDDATMREIATKNMQSGSARMEAAIEKMKAAFMREEVTAAIGKLADALPKLATIVADVVSFTAENPKTAAALAVGGVAAKGMASAAGGVLLEAGMKRGGAAAASMFASAFGIAAKEAAPVIGQGLATTAAPAMANIFGASVPMAAMGGVFAAAAAGALIAAVAAKNTYDKLDDKSKGHGMALWWANAKRNLHITSNREYMQEAGALTGEDFSDKLNPDKGSVSASDRANARKDARAANEAAGYEVMEVPPSDDSWEGGAGPRADFVPKTPAAAPAQQAARSREDAELFAQMMGQKEVKVRIMNPEAIRGNEGGGGPPGPGYGDRP